MSDLLKGPENSQLEVGPPCRVNVRLMQNQDGVQWANVQVHSRRKPDLCRQGNVRLSGTTTEMCQKVGWLAGGIAETLCADYGDQVEPSEIANLAVECYMDCWKEVHG